MPAAKKPAPAAVEKPLFEPIVITSRPADEAVEMVELFSIDGKSYMIPAAPAAGLAMQVIDDTVQHGSGIAEMMMLKRVIGDDAYQALAACSGTKGGHLARIAKAVTEVTLGALEDDDEGNS